MDPSLLEKLKARFVIDLLPSKLGDVQQGVRDHLNGLLLRYNEDFEGVLLAYSNERVLTKQGHIHAYFPLVRVEVVADVVLFRPQLGKRLVGVVNKVGADYIGLLVLGFINAAIGADQIRAEFRCNLGEGAWESSLDPQHRLAVGTAVHFTLHAVQHEGEFLSVMGSLLRPSTGAEGRVKPAKFKDAAASNGGGGKAAQSHKRRPEQQQQQQQQQPYANGTEKQKKQKPKDRKDKRQQGTPAQQQEGAQEQQRQQQAQVQQAQVQQPPPSAQPAAADTPTAAAAARKTKKRKAEQAPADPPAAQAGVSAGPKKKKKKKESKDGA